VDVGKGTHDQSSILERKKITNREGRGFRAGAEWKHIQTHLKEGRCILLGGAERHKIARRMVSTTL